MRLAVLADVHGNAWALEAVLADARRHSPDQYVVLGDLLADGPAPLATHQQLATLTDAVFVRGNTDRYLAHLEALGPPRSELPDLVETWQWGLEQVGEAGRQFLARLPSHSWIDTPAGRVLATHGIPEDDEAVVLPRLTHSADPLKRDGARVALIGHTHAPFLWQTAGVFVINPGSVGLSPATTWRASYALLTLLGNGELVAEHKQVDWDVAAFVSAFESGIPINRKAGPMLEELRDRVQ